MIYYCNIRKKSILFIVFTLILIIFSPMIFGFEFKVSKENEFLEDLTFFSYNRNLPSKFVYIKEHFNKVHLSIDDHKSEVIGKIISLYPTDFIYGPMNSPWPMQCYNVNHTSQSPYSTIDNSYDEKWRFWTDGWIDDTPVIDNDGVIYFGGSHNNLGRYLYAINPDGTEKWKYKTGGLIAGSSPAISEDGTIYVGAWDDYFYAINPDGTLKWKFLAHDSIASSPAIADDGTIYFGTMGTGYRIYAINPNGTEKWYYTTGFKVTSDPAIAEDGTVYIGSGDSYLYALYPNGTLRWRYKTGDEIHGDPSIAEDGTIYIGSWDDYLHAIYQNGTRKWKVYTGWGTSNCQAINEDGTIYVGTNKLRAYYPNGTLKWSLNLGAENSVGKSSPVICSDGIIYIGLHHSEGAGGYIIAINPDGTERWRKKIAKEWVDSSPSVGSDGTVYIGSASLVSGESWGYLHAFGNIESNELPNAPDITGKTNGKPGVEYSYTFIPIDPDNNPVRLYIDWGDGTIIDWTREYASGEQVQFKHSWSEEGVYIIKAKVKDSLDVEGPWSYLEVNIPRTRTTTSYHWFEWLIKQFPMLERLMDLIK